MDGFFDEVTFIFSLNGGAESAREKNKFSAPFCNNLLLFFVTTVFFILYFDYDWRSNDELDHVRSSHKQDIIQVCTVLHCFECVDTIVYSNGERERE